MSQAKSIRSYRMIVLFALVLLELTLVGSFRTLGWYGTGSTFQWIACLVAMILPLGAAVLLLVWKRLRFNIRTLLVSTALVAVFLYISGMPLVEYHTARSISRKLLAEKTTLKTMRFNDDFYSQLKFDPRLKPPSPKVAELPFWLQPLAREASSIPADNSVRDIWLNTDAQLKILCEDPSRFESLENVGMSPEATFATPRITLDGLTLFQKSLSRFPQLQAIHINSIQVPENWYASLSQICILWVWAEGPMSGFPFPASDLEDIASLPNLHMLMIYGYGLTDSDAMLLSKSKSLKYILFRRSALTPNGEAALSAAMPDCILQRD